MRLNRASRCGGGDWLVLNGTCQARLRLLLCCMEEFHTVQLTVISILFDSSLDYSSLKQVCALLACPLKSPVAQPTCVSAICFSLSYCALAEGKGSEGLRFELWSARLVLGALLWSRREGGSSASASKAVQEHMTICTRHRCISDTSFVDRKWLKL